MKICYLLLLDSDVCVCVCVHVFKKLVTFLIYSLRSLKLKIIIFIL